jgi:hypothetical protein
MQDENFVCPKYMALVKKDTRLFLGPPLSELKNKITAPEDESLCALNI